MPVSKNIKLLQESLTQTKEAAAHLSISVNRCNNFIDASSYSEEQLIELEALTGRFARLSDLLIQKVLKTIERLDGDSPGTVRDRIIAAEKKGIINNSALLIEIRDVRNMIAHDYESSAFDDIVSFVIKNSSFLLQTIQKAEEYSKKFL